MPRNPKRVRFSSDHVDGLSRFGGFPLCYNDLNMGFRIVARTVVALLLASLLGLQPLRAHPASRAAVAAPASTGIYLVFPFENEGSSPHLDWLGEGLEHLVISRLSAGGEEVYSRSGRISELERYGLPASAKLSHATMLRMAQDLDADYVILGSFHSDGASLTVEARLLVVSPATLLPKTRESGRLDSLMDLATRLTWKLLGERGSYGVTLTDFAKKQRPLRLDAFEHYIRGLTAIEDDGKIRDLREAARLEPTWPDPDYALGDLYFSRNDCNSALPWFARVPKEHDRYAESVFSAGVCYLLLGNPQRAEETFRSLQTSAPAAPLLADSPELLNDLALAKARQGKAAAAETDLRRAMELGPDEDDYPVNLGLLALRANDFKAAAVDFREAIEREPDNPEDRSLLIYALEKAGKQDEAEEERSEAAESFGPNGVQAIHMDAKNAESWARLERLRTELDPAELRPEFRIAPDPNGADAPGAAAVSVVAHVRSGRQALAANQLDAATKQFQAALAADPRSSSAHRGLAEIARKQGRLDEAVKELQASLIARNSAAVRTMLARVYLEQKKPDLARAEVEKALKLAPNYAEAKQLLEHLQKSGDTKPDEGVR
jgi:tetratricopeptide (TPR) repeat protein